MNDPQERDAHDDGQQGTGGVASGQATSTPDQNGRQPHLGSQPDANSAPGGSGQGGSDSSEGIAAVDRIDQAGVSGQSGSPTQTPDASTGRLDTIDEADDRTAQSGQDRARDIGAQTPGDPGDLLSRPLGDGNYRKQGDVQVPLANRNDSSRDGGTRR
jgi:hypothetical protein